MTHKIRSGTPKQNFATHRRYWTQFQNNFPSLYSLNPYEHTLCVLQTKIATVISRHYTVSNLNFKATFYTHTHTSLNWNLLLPAVHSNKYYTHPFFIVVACCDQNGVIPQFWPPSRFSPSGLVFHRKSISMLLTNYGFCGCC